MAVPSNIKLTGDRRDDLGIIRRAGYTSGPASMPGFDYGGVHYVTPIVQGAFWDGQGWDMPVKDGLFDEVGNFFDDFADDFKKGHTLGQFIQNTTGSEGLATVFDPAYNDVQDNMEPIAFGAPGKDNPITGVEGGGVFDDPYISTLVNMFAPGYVGAIANMGNTVVDYENAKKQGYDVSYGDTVGRGAANTGASMYLNSGDTYGYGSSALGKAGTAATTSGIVSAANGADEEQIARNAVISGLSSYAGSSAKGAYENAYNDTSDAPRGVDSQYSSENLGNWASGNTAGAFAGNLSNFGLRSLWKDPSANADSEYYQRIINSLSGYRNQLNNSQSSSFDLEGIENTPEGQQLMALFQQQQENDPQSRKSKIGGSGQYGQGSDQVEQDMMREDGYLA